MKYAVLLLLFISSPAFTMDGSYQLPSKETLTERLKKAELKEFAYRSNIAHILGDSWAKPIELHSFVSSTVKKYNNTPILWIHQDFKKGLYDSKQPTVSVIMTLLLQDHPRALTALEKNYDGVFLR